MFRVLDKEPHHDDRCPQVVETACHPEVELVENRHHPQQDEHHGHDWTEAASTGGKADGHQDIGHEPKWVEQVEQPFATQGVDGLQGHVNSHSSVVPEVMVNLRGDHVPWCLDGVGAVALSVKRVEHIEIIVGDHWRKPVHHGENHAHEEQEPAQLLVLGQ